MTPWKIWENTKEVIEQALWETGIKAAELAAIGITNQRETTVVWDKSTGKPFGNAIVWQCTRTHEICKELMADGGQDRFRAKTGLRGGHLFQRAQDQVDNGKPSRGRPGPGQGGRPWVGTMESWIIWWLTGGPDGGSHVTDVTNASRTMLMDLDTLDWDPELLSILGIPAEALPRHRALQRQGHLGRHPSGRALWGRGAGLRRPGAISRPPWWARPAFSLAKPKTPMARDASCS